MRNAICTLAAAFAFSTAASAQSAAELIARGDRDHAALSGAAALASYEAALALDPQSYEAAWKASRSAMDLGGSAATASQRDTWFRAGERYARKAVSLNPTDAEAHFSLARALGKAALQQSARGRIRYATEVRNEALRCLELDPRHAGCLHVLGVWNAEVMRLNGFTRAIARNVLGGRAFGSASWKEAVRYMEAAVAVEPRRIAHRADLAEIYLDVGERAKAKSEYETILRLPAADFEDRRYKAAAEAALKKL